MSEWARDEQGTVIEARPIAPDPPSLPHPAWGDLTARGNGERIVEAHGADIRHAPNQGWYEWDGARWAADPENKRVRSRAKTTLLELYRRLPGATKRDGTFILGSQDPAAWQAALNVASLHPPVSTTFEHLDDGARAPTGHASRLNVTNGTVDLETGLLAEHRRVDMITKLAPVLFDPNAAGLRWHAFLVQAQPDEQVRAFLQRLAGYWLSGEVRDEIFPIFCGLGGNGKGTYLDTIRRAMGDYSATISEDVLIARSGAHPTGLMVFRGLRLAVASETGEGDALAISTMKRLTGGDAIRARYMGKDFIEFEPTHKLVLMTNPRPRLKGTVNASLRRRIFFIPWDQTFGRETADTSLKASLGAAEEMSAVLNWMMDGYRIWKRVGLAAPACVLSATDDYMAAEDALGMFVEDKLEFGVGFEVSAGHMYKGYRDYCKDVGELDVVRSQDFKPSFLARPDVQGAKVEWKRTASGRVYVGVQIKARSAEEHQADAERGKR